MRHRVDLSPETVTVLERLKAPEESLDAVIRRLAAEPARPAPHLEDDESAVC